MAGHTRTMLRDLGRLIHVPGLMALASLPICILFDEYYAIGPFVWTALAALAAGQLLYRLFRDAEEVRLYDAALIAALGWVVVPLFGALPLLMIAYQPAGLEQAPQTVIQFQSPWNAFFEAVSGFTSTGLTMALRPSELPHTVQWWRSFMQWVGGVGVIVLMLSILRPHVSAHHFYHSEAREEKIFPTVASTVRTIWWIYLLYTVLSLLILRLAGMAWWPAINHGMTGIATGGFGITDHSAGDFTPAAQLALVPIMLAGAVSFATHYRMISERRAAILWRDTQHRALWLLFGGGVVLLLFENRWSAGSFRWIDSLFQWTSALCTAGFQTVDLHGWSPTAKLLLSLGMILGGAAGSTVGGVKLIRLVTLYKGLLWYFRRTFRLPHEVIRYELDGKGLGESEADRLVQGAAVLVVLWTVLLWIGVLTLLHVVPPRFTLDDVIVEVASAQGNVGLSTGITHPDLAWTGKLVLILAMWLGRLEIVPVLILFSALFSGSRWVRSRG